MDAIALHLYGNKFLHLKEWLPFTSNNYNLTQVNMCECYGCDLEVMLFPLVLHIIIMEITFIAEFIIIMLLHIVFLYWSVAKHLVAEIYWFLIHVHTTGFVFGIAHFYELILFLKMHSLIFIFGVVPTSKEKYQEWLRKVKHTLIFNDFWDGICEGQDDNEPTFPEENKEVAIW